MTSILDTLTTILVPAIGRLVNMLPVNLRIRIIAAIINLFLFLFPKYKQVGRDNLAIVFPSWSRSEQNQFLRKVIESHARLLMDFFRLPYLTDEWYETHYSFEDGPPLQQSNGERPGYLIPTAHMGSFELTGHAVAARLGSFRPVARIFQLPKFDDWWNSVRERRNCWVIGRKGAFQEIAQTLSGGESVAILFDQNVRRQHAVFVDFFGKAAATSRTIALAALRTGAPITFAVGCHIGNDNYRLFRKECPTADLLANQTLSSDEKVLEITQRLSKLLEEAILRYPEQWFWFHRRWKTRPHDNDPSLYR